MSDETKVYAGQIKSITGKIQVTENHGTNTEKRAARMEDLTALSAGVVHKTINEDKTEAVKISGNLETTNQISAKTVVANDSISVSNTELNANGFETDGDLTAAGDATIGGNLFVGGKLTVKGENVSGTTDQSLAIVAPTVEIAVKTDEDPVIVAKVTDDGTQTEIKADTVKTAANKEVEISAAEVITEASSKSTIIAPEIWLKDSNSDSPVNYIKVEDSNDKVVLNAPNINLFANSSNTYLKVVNSTNSSNIELKATNISLDGTANTTASLSYETDEFKTVKSHTGGDILSETTVPYHIVNNNALRSYNKAVDAKITTTKNDLKGSIDKNATDIATINSTLGTHGISDSGNSPTVWGEIKAIQDNISNGLHFRGVFTDKNKVDNPKPGDLIIIGTQEYVYNDTNSEWQELGDENTHATYNYVDTKLADKVAELEKADEALETKLQGNIDDKAAQGDFDALKGRVDGHDTAIADKVAQGDFNALTGRVNDHDTAIAAKLESSVYDTHITAYSTKVEALEAKDTEFADKISAIETSLSTGDIHTEIDGVRTLAQQGVNDAAAVSDRVTTLENKLPSQYKLDTGLFGELETDTEGNLTGALIIRTVQKQAAAVNEINNNEVY